MAPRLSVLMLALSSVLWIPERAASTPPAPSQQSGPAREATAPSQEIDPKAFAALFAPQGGPLSFEDTQREFKALQPKLEKALSLLEQCVPRRTDDYNIVWSDVASGGDPLPVHCTQRQGDAPLDELIAVMKDARVLSVGYSVGADARANPHVETAAFMVFRQGMAGFGSSTTLEYHASTSACSASLARDPGGQAGLERRALTSGPCHWVWEHDEG